MSAISGALGANAQQNAASTAADATTRAAQMQIDAANKQYDTTRADYQPYRDLGSAGMDNILGKSGATNISGITDDTSTAPTYADSMAGVPGYSDSMKGKNFDSVMAGYDPATAVERERKTGLESLGNGMASRGIRGMSAVNKMSDFNDAKNADLSNRQLAFNQQRYAAGQTEGNSMYNNVRNEATQKYQGGVNDWQLKKAANQDRYNNLLKLVDVGRNANGTVSGAGQTATNTAVNAIGQMGQSNANAAMASGQATSQMMQGIGKTGTQIAGAAIKQYNSSPSAYQQGPSNTAQMSDMTGPASDYYAQQR